MDIDAYVSAHRAEWDRLEHLVRRANRPRRLSGGEVDELVALYQRAATHLSVVRSASPDPALVSRLSSLVVQGRTAVTGSSTAAWRDAARFVAVTFPVATYRAWPWWTGPAAVFLLVSFLTGAWIVGDPDVQRALLPDDEVRELVRPGGSFEAYYSSDPAGAFAARVWTNNAWVGAGALATGVFLGLPTIAILISNAVSVGAVGGFMAANGAADRFFGLILPHGLLELTAVFVAAGLGLKLGWTVIDPGPRRRLEALGAEGRTAITVAFGLVFVFLISGVIEAFVTPSSLPTWARIMIGLQALCAFLAYVIVLGRRGVRAGETGDLALGLRPDEAPSG